MTGRMHGAWAATLAVAIATAMAAGCNNAARPDVAEGAPRASLGGPAATVAPVAPVAPVATATELDAGAAASERPLAGLGIRVVVAPADADAVSLVRAERLRAKHDGRVLVVYVGAGWCEPCRAMKREIESGRLDARLAKVTLLAFDADRDADRLAAGGYAFRFIPYVALAGADGRALASQEARGHGKDAWRELIGTLDEWQSRTP